ncbi:hypothetical protein JF541_16735 [Marinobacter hydrocarbonoclasticus]|uniref:hypothetical protein n=1 Tax=Marinobacter nauticus TaxID=2743 RepID=UPI001A8C6988|nr:hypothetical protein [Marinobacter nauticus]MBN8240810.1 hypothetical protein [Marinobacter nauticus]
MNRSEHDANRHLTHFVNHVDEVIQQAIEKADKGRFVVATSEAGNVLLLPHFNASLRQDLTWVYDTEFGYVFSPEKRSA